MISIFGPKKFPALNDPRTVQLLRQATVDMNYGAVQDLYEIYKRAAPDGRLWGWWIDQAAALARAGHRSVAMMAVDFARKANIEPWGDLSDQNYADLRAVEAM